VTVFCGAMVGASIGFLWYNAHPAEIFMGDDSDELSENPVFQTLRYPRQIREDALLARRVF
jgi:hypothetical protein